MSSLQKIISKRIREARKRRGATQKDLAIRLDRTPASVSDIERSKVQVSAVDLKTIADFLAMPIEYFYGENFSGEDVEKLIVMVRNMDQVTRDRLLPTMRAIAEFQEISTAIQNTDPSDQQALFRIAERFYATLQPFLENVDDLYRQGRELNSRLSEILER